MTLQTRVLLMVTSLLGVTVLTTAIIMTWSARQSLLSETEQNGILIAEIIARSSSFAGQVPRDNALHLCVKFVQHLFDPWPVLGMIGSINQFSVGETQWITPPQKRPTSERSAIPWTIFAAN